MPTVATRWGKQFVMRTLLLVLLTWAVGCRGCGETCAACVEQCAPFVVEQCRPLADFSLHCLCDATRRAEVP